MRYVPEITTEIFDFEEDKKKENMKKFLKTVPVDQLCESRSVVHYKSQ